MISDEMIHRLKSAVVTVCLSTQGDHKNLMIQGSFTNCSKPIAESEKFSCRMITGRTVVKKLIGMVCAM